MALRSIVVLSFLGLGLTAFAQERAINAPLGSSGLAPPDAAPEPRDPDCDGSGGLDVFDYLCFQSRFAAGDPGADFDGSGVFDAFDFLGFQNAFAEGFASPDWMGAAPGEWCMTFQRYAAGLEDQGNPAVVCAPIGPCDVPADRNASIPDGNTPIKTFRLSIHVFCDDNGGNCAATPADVNAAVARLNADYAPWRIQFVAQSNFINSTRYRTADPGDEWFMKKTYADSPATKLNIYVIENGGMCWGTFPFSQDPLGKQGGIVMDDTFFVAATPIPGILTHEVGHCLGLWHTFNGTDEVTQCGDCYEAAGRSAVDGDIVGDRCSDTNPTPKNSNHCYDPPGTDPCNGIPWLDTPYHNFMSYSHVCPPYDFTPQQAGRMHCWSEDVLSGWMELPPPPAVPGTPNLTKPGGGQVQATWADNSADENGFRLQRETKSGKKWLTTQIVATVGADITTANDAPGTGTFRYRVQAFNVGGDSAWSAWREIVN